MKNYEKMCEECAELRIIKGVWCCEECFGQHCDDLDECPLGLTPSNVVEAQTLTEEQQKVEKKMRNVDTHELKTKVQRQRKPNEDKRYLLNLFTQAIANEADKPIEITNIEREFVFYFNDKKYKITLSAPRS